MSTFGEDLIRSLNEALAHAKGKGPAVPHTPAAPREVRKREKPTSHRPAGTRPMKMPGTSPGMTEGGGE